MVGTSEVIKSPFLDLDNGAVVAKILADDFDPTSVVPEPLPPLVMTNGEDHGECGGDQGTAKNFM